MEHTIEFEAATEHTSRTLPCRLTREELLQKTIVVSDQMDRLNKLNIRKKQLADKYKELIDSTNSEIDILRKVIREKLEERLVDIEIKIDRESNTYTETRMDTWEILSERTLTETERQLNIMDIIANAPINNSEEDLEDDVNSFTEDELAEDSYMDGEL